MVARPTRVSVEVGNVRVPVLTIWEMTGVVRVGEVAKTATPDPVSSDKELRRAAEAPVEDKLEEASVNIAREEVKSGRLTTPLPESMTMLPVVLPPRVSVCKAVPCKVGVPKSVKAPEREADPSEVNLNFKLPDFEAVIKSRSSSTFKFNLAAPVATPKATISPEEVSFKIVPSSVQPLVVTSVAVEEIVIFCQM